jgi:hypothetical protein
MKDNLIDICQWCGARNKEHGQQIEHKSGCRKKHIGSMSFRFIKDKMLAKRMVEYWEKQARENIISYPIEEN